MLSLIMADDTGSLIIEATRTDEMVEDVKTEHGIDIDAMLIFHLRKAFQRMERAGDVGTYHLKLMLSRSNDLSGITVEPVIERKWASSPGVTVAA